MKALVLFLLPVCGCLPYAVKARCDVAEKIYPHATGVPEMKCGIRGEVTLVSGGKK